MGFSLWSPPYHSAGSPGHVRTSAVASPSETEKTKPGSRAAQYCSVSEHEELRCSQTAVLPSHSSLCHVPHGLGRLMLFLGMSRTSSFVVSERSDASEPKVDIKNPVFLLLKKYEITNSYKHAFSVCNELCYRELRDLEEDKDVQLLSGKPAFTAHKHTAVQPQKGGPSHPLLSP